MRQTFIFRSPRSSYCQINRTFHRHVSVSFKGTQAKREEAIGNRARYHVVAVVTMHNGSLGIKVLPRVLPKVLHFLEKKPTSMIFYAMPRSWSAMVA